MGEGIDDPSVLFDFPVHVRPGGGAGHPDERDRLATRNSVADPHERRGRVVVAALDAFGVLDADAPAADLDPARGVDDTVVRGDDDRTERSGDVDPGVTALKERVPKRLGSVAIARSCSSVGSHTGIRSKTLPPGTVAETAPTRRRPSAVQSCTVPGKLNRGADSSVPLGSITASLSFERTSRVSPRGDHSVKVASSASSFVIAPVAVAPIYRSVVPSRW